MSEAKHTPGPWHQDQYGNVKDSKGETVRITGVSLPCGRIRSDDECHGNSLLVAAAPELLEVLQELVDSEYEFAAVANKARLVIAKATGVL